MADRDPKKRREAVLAKLGLDGRNAGRAIRAASTVASPSDCTNQRVSRLGSASSALTVEASASVLPPVCCQ